MANQNQLQLKSRVFVTSNLKEYVQVASHVINATDIVLEVGSHNGNTTKEIAAFAHTVIGIDHTEEAIRKARNSYPNLQFQIMDGFNLMEIKQLGIEFDVVFINMTQIAGYSSLLDSICLVNSYLTVIRPRILVINNKALKSLVSQCYAWNTLPNLMEDVNRLRSGKGTKFIGTRGVEEFRDSINFWVDDDDLVLEIGCEWGTTTEVIEQKAKLVLGTDVSAVCIERAKKMRPHIQFAVLDGFNVRSALEFGISFNKIYIDISGLSGYRSLLDVISLLRTYETIFRPEAIVIKSGALKHFASHFSIWAVK